MPFPPMLTEKLSTAPVPRRVRALVGGEAVVDATGARYVWEHPWYPQFYLPPDSFGAQATPEGEPEEHAVGTVTVHDLHVGDRTIAGALRRVEHSEVPDLAGWWHLRWDAADTWLEEDEEIIVHPRSPYVRVDCLPSSRTVRIELKGVVLAESDDPMLLFETGLPTRYYLPSEDVVADVLVPNELRTSCPYKGAVSDYWDVVVGDRTYRNMAWRYAETLPEAAPVAGRIAFLNEKVEVYLDGELQPRP